MTVDNYEKDIMNIESSIQWNSECALIQKRYLKAFIDAKILLVHPIMYVEQMWETLPK